MVIKCFHLKDLTPKQIKEEMDSTLITLCHSIQQFKKLFAEFKVERTSTSDETLSGHPVKVTTPGIVEKIHQIALKDCRLRLFEVAKAVKISKEHASNSLTNILGFHKVSTMWMPRLVTLNHMLHRRTVSSMNLEFYRKNPKEFLRQNITMNETWILHYTPESKL